MAAVLDEVGKSVGKLQNDNHNDHKIESVETENEGLDAAKKKNRKKKKKAGMSIFLIEILCYTSDSFQYIKAVNLVSCIYIYL